MKISVVLGTYNRLNFLKLTIQSIREEFLLLDSCDIEHEIIVVDGGSNDGTLDWLVEQKDIITILQHNRGEWQNKLIERKSWGYFMNLGFKCAQGKYICMLSDDCLVVPNAILNGIKIFEQSFVENEKVGAIAFFWRDWSKQIKYHVGYTLGDNMYVNHGLFLNSALKEIDYIDEQTFFFYNGDGDLSLKLLQKGYKTIKSSDSYIEHYPHANLGIIKTNHEKQKEDNLNYFKKWENIFYDKSLHNIGKVEEKKFVDTLSTYKKFESIHNSIILQNPEIVKKDQSLLRKLFFTSLQ